MNRLCLLSIIFIFSIHNMSFGKERPIGSKIEVPFTIFQTEEEYDALFPDSIIGNDALFKAFKSIKTSPKKTYWVRLDFENEKEVLARSSELFLWTKDFSFMTLYQKVQNEIVSNRLGLFEKKRGEFFSSHMQTGIAFKKENLIHERYLYIKIKHIASYDDIADWVFTYGSFHEAAINNFFYTKKDTLNLIPYYFFAGLAFIIVTVTFIYFLSSKKPEFLFYSLFVFFSTIFLSGESPELTFYILGKYTIGSHIFFESSATICNILYLLFIMSYLNTKEYYSKLHLGFKLLLVILFISLLTYPLAILADDYNTGLIIRMTYQTTTVAFGTIAIYYLTFYSKNHLSHFVVYGAILYMSGILWYVIYENLIYFIVGLSLEITIFTLGLIYKIRKEQIEKLKIVRESNKNRTMALRAQMNPHFIFNVLNSIQSLVLQGQTKTTIKYLTKFSQLTRTLLESSFEDTVCLYDEIKMLNYYIELESLRFDNSFNYTINIEDNVDAKNIEIPLLAIQPYVENAIVHGLVHKEQGTYKKVSLCFKRSNNFLQCTIDDNGIGRVMSRKIQERLTYYKRKSRGMEISQQRIENICKKKSITFIDKYNQFGDPIGTTVLIRVSIN